MYIYVQCAIKYVIGRVVRSLECNVLIGLGQNDVVETHGSELEGRTLKETGHNSVAIHLVAWTLQVEGTHWGVMRHLL